MMIVAVESRCAPVQPRQAPIRNVLPVSPAVEVAVLGAFLETAACVAVEEQRWTVADPAALEHYQPTALDWEIFLQLLTGLEVGRYQVEEEAVKLRLFTGKPLSHLRRRCAGKTSSEMKAVVLAYARGEGDA